MIEGNITEKWVVLKRGSMKPQYYNEFRMFFVTGGFGAHDGLLGSKIFGHHYDGERAQWYRQDVDRLANEEEVKGVSK